GALHHPCGRAAAGHGRGRARAFRARARAEGRGVRARGGAGMIAITQRLALAGLLALALLPGASARQRGLIQPPLLEQRVAKGELPPIAERLPKKPLVVHLEDRKREIGRYGGDVRTLVAKPRDLRYVTVNGYTRLVGYDETLALKPDLLEHVENEG